MGLSLRYAVCRKCGNVAAVDETDRCWTCRSTESHGRRGGLRRPRMGDTMKRFALMVVAVTGSALLLVSNALAVTVPDIPVSAYGNSLLTGLANAVTDVLPYAAAITAFAIGVGLIRRWLGAKKATRV